MLQKMLQKNRAPAPKQRVEGNRDHFSTLLPPGAQPFKGNLVDFEYRDQREVDSPQFRNRARSQFLKIIRFFLMPCRLLVLQDRQKPLGQY